MHISKIKTSKFLSKDDCNPPLLLTIDGLTRENVAMESQPPEFKFCLHFREQSADGQPIKPLVLNSINAQLIAGFMGSEETDNWTGKQIVAYNDPTISFAGKITGGIRVRAPKVKGVAVPAKVEPADQDGSTSGYDPELGF